MFWYTLLYVYSSIALILMGKRDLVALLNLSSWCLVMVEQLFLTVPRGYLRFVIVVFPDHTHLLFLYSWLGQVKYSSLRQGFFTIYGHSGHLVMWQGPFKQTFITTCYTEFEFNWPSGFRCEDVWKCWWMEAGVTSHWYTINSPMSLRLRWDKNSFRLN